MLKLKLTRKKLYLVSLVACILIIGSIGAALWMKNMASVDTKNDPSSSKTVEEVENGALSYVDSGDVDGGLKYYDEQIEKREDNNEKKNLLIAKSNFALQADRHEEAVSAAEQANEISSDIASVEVLARTYEANGDKQNALVYYKKVLEMSPKEGMGGRYNPIWEEKIAELEQ